MAHIVTQQDFGPDGLSLTGGFLGQLQNVIMHIGQEDTTQFTGYSKVARKYVARFTIKNGSQQQMTLTIFHDPERPNFESPSKGWQTHIGPSQTGTYTTTWTTIFKVGGNSGAAPPDQSEVLVHSFFTFNGKSYSISNHDTFTWNGTNMLKSSVVG